MFIIRNLLSLKTLNGKEVEDLGLNFTTVDDNFGIRKVKGYSYIYVSQNTDLQLHFNDKMIKKFFSNT